MDKVIFKTECMFEFNRFYVIESLGSSEAHTGTELCEYLKTTTDALKYTSTGVITISGREGWSQLMDFLKTEISQEALPILRFEIHGDSEGLYLNNGDLIKWRDVYNDLSDLNRLMHCNLMVTFAVCFGLNILRQIRFDNIMPFCFTVGSMKKMYNNHIPACFKAFYNEFFSTRDIDKAVKALNKENLWDDEYVPIKMDMLFAYLHYCQGVIMEDESKAIRFAESSILKLPSDITDQYPNQVLVRMFLDKEIELREEDYLKRVENFFNTEDDPENWNRFWICNTTAEIMNYFKDSGVIKY